MGLIRKEEGRVGTGMLLFRNPRTKSGQDGETMATTTRTRAKATGKKKTTAKRKTTSKRKTTAKGKTTTKRKTTAKTTAKRKKAGKGKATAKRKTTAMTSGGPDCSISKAEFRKGAERMVLQIGSWGDGAAKYELDPREFSSGSFGWFASEKLVIPVGDKRVRCQMSLNVTVIGSKNSR